MNANLDSIVDHQVNTAHAIIHFPTSKLKDSPGDYAEQRIDAKHFNQIMGTANGELINMKEITTGVATPSEFTDAPFGLVIGHTDADGTFTALNSPGSTTVLGKDGHLRRFHSVSTHPTPHTLKVFPTESELTSMQFDKNLAGKKLARWTEESTESPFGRVMGPESVYVGVKKSVHPETKEEKLIVTRGEFGKQNAIHRLLQRNNIGAKPPKGVSEITFDGEPAYVMGKDQFQGLEKKLGQALKTASPFVHDLTFRLYKAGKGVNPSQVEWPISFTREPIVPKQEVNGVLNTKLTFGDLLTNHLNEKVDTAVKADAQGIESTALKIHPGLSKDYVGAVKFVAYEPGKE